MRREAQLRPDFANRYPTLVPGRWYTAAALAGLIKGRRILAEGQDLEFPDRILHPHHFEFRGGQPRRGPWLGLRTRYRDRHPTLTRVA